MGEIVPADISGIVLCGGLSRRMGIPKAWLPWGEQTLLGHVVETLRPLVKEVIVVARAGQALPRTSVRIVTDRIQGAGPLGGLEAGLAAIRASYGIVVACDMPWLNPRLLKEMAALAPPPDSSPFGARQTRVSGTSDAPATKRGGSSGGGVAPGWDLVIPYAFGSYHPLHAIYAKHLETLVAGLLSQGEHRLHVLVKLVKARVVEEPFIRTYDPLGKGLRSLDYRRDYEEAYLSVGQATT